MLAGGGSFVFGACQIATTGDKNENIRRAKEGIDKAVEKGAQVVCLPECWNSPYSTAAFPVYAETVSGLVIGEAPSLVALADKARQHGVFVIGGSIPERDKADGKMYNTCFVFDPQGRVLGKYRKMHLFDMVLQGSGILFKESDVLSPGNDLLAFDTPWGKIGIGICYDLRFPELARLYQQIGVVMIVYPGAFTFRNGKAHWKLHLRSRAVDNQVFVAGVAPALDVTFSYHSWAHSLIASPCGSVLAKTGIDPDVIVAPIDVDRLSAIRQQEPCLFHVRPTVYGLSFL